MKSHELSRIEDKLVLLSDIAYFNVEMNMGLTERKLVKKMLMTETVLTVIKKADLHEIRNENAMILMEIKSQELFFERVPQDVQRYLRALSIYQKSKLTQEQWNADINLYKKIPDSIRFYNVSDSGRITLNKRCQVENKRGYAFWCELDAICKGNEERRLNFLTKATEDTVFYTKYESDGEYKFEKKKFLPCYLSDTETFEFDSSKYRINTDVEKKHITLSKTMDMRAMLDLISDKPKKLPLIELLFEGGRYEIKVDGVIHVVGALAAGKSNFKKSLIAYLIKNNLVNRVAVVEDSVSTVLEIVSALRGVGINAIPVIGKDEDKYMKNYSETLSGELSSIEDEQIVKWIRGNCFVESTLAQLDSSKNYEKRNYCEKFEGIEVVDGEKRLIKNGICPFISICGKMERYRQMNGSPVWIMTSAALTSAMIPTPFNAKKQTMFELTYDCCDLVIMDEVDGTQKTLDERLIDEKGIFKGKDLISDLRKLEKMVRKSKENSPEISNIYHALSSLVKAINHFNDLSVFSKYAISSLAEEKIITPRTIAQKIMDSIEPNREFEKQLKQLCFFSSPQRYDSEKEKEIIEGLESNDVYVAYKMFSAQNPTSHFTIQEKYTRVFEKIKNYCDTFNLTYKTNVPSQLELLSNPKRVDTNNKLNKRYAKLRNKGLIELGGNATKGFTVKDKIERDIFITEMLLFLVVLIEIDHNYKQIILNCEMIRNDEEEALIDVEQLRTLSFYGNPTSNFTNEPIIESVTGYSLQKIDEGSQYELQFLSYSGVGRELIHRLNNVKKPLGKVGPGVIGMSGTSHLTSSPHFNFDVAPSILLRPINEDGTLKKEGKIEMEYIPIVGSNGAWVRNSGIKDKKYKAKSYSEVIGSEVFLNKLRSEIKDGKRALIVAASYSDAKLVQPMLEAKGFSSICLKQEGDDEETYTSIYKSLVEQIAFNEEYKDKDCLIVGAKTIYRGYNILDENFVSYFNSVFFLSRPYPVPYSYKNAVTVMHAEDAKFIKEYQKDIKKNSKEFLKYDKERSLRAEKIFEKYYRMGKWDELDLEQKKAVSAEAFSYIKQMIGRLQRGQSDCKVYFFDSAFCTKKEITTLGRRNGDSMFDYWKIVIEEMFEENEDMSKPLYESFYNALLEMMKTARKRYF